MVYRILYTEDALEDLRAVLDYILFDNPKAAERFGTAVLNHVDLLKSFPRMGARVPKRPGVRKILHSPISVYDRIEEARHQIEILHFWHTSRRIPLSIR